MISADFISVYPEADPALINKALCRYSEKRLPHVLGCTAEACRLADLYGIDTDMAFNAALLHDVTKNLSFDRQLQLCDIYDIVDKDFLRESPAVLHAYTGAEIAFYEFGQCDEAARAIRFHTSGRAGMSELEKIIYLADIIEPSRNFEGVDELRRAAAENTDRAMYLSLRSTVKHLEQNGSTVFYRTLEALDYFEKLI